MTLWAVIPVKPIAEGKSRLAGTLPPHIRERLNSLLFRQTLDAVAAVIPPENIIVVSRDFDLLAQASARRMWAMAEQNEGLNEALAQAAALLPDDALLAISTDLPEITAADVRALLQTANAPQPAVAIAPDRSRCGTNALLTAPAGCIPFCFGKESFSTHLEAARQIGIRPEIITRPGLAFDLDLPEDLQLCPPGWLK